MPQGVSLLIVQDTAADPKQRHNCSTNKSHAPVSLSTGHAAPHALGGRDQTVVELRPVDGAAARVMAPGRPDHQLLDALSRNERVVAE